MGVLQGLRESLCMLLCVLVGLSALSAHTAAALTKALYSNRVPWALLLIALLLKDVRWHEWADACSSWSSCC